MTRCGARVSRRTMSTWTSCAHRRSPSMRTWRAYQAAAISGACASKSSAQIPARHLVITPGVRGTNGRGRAAS